MSTIVLRSTKGSPLTNTEVDNNFNNLNNDKAQFATSAALRGYLSDATGTGSAVFAISPTINTSLVAGTTSFDLLNAVATTINAFGAATALTLGAMTGTTLVQNTLHCLGDIQAFSTSDARLKDNVVPISNALEKILQLRGVIWTWNPEYRAKKLAESPNAVMSPEIGVIAQEVLPVFPELVTERADGYLAVDYPRLTAVLIEAVKELSTRVFNLESEQGIV